MTNEIDTVLETGYEIASVPFLTKNTFFAPAHLSIKHLFETSFSEKLVNTRDIMMGYKPGAQILNLLPYNISILDFSNGTRTKEFTINPGLIDVATLGLFLIIPYILTVIPVLLGMAGYYLGEIFQVLTLGATIPAVYILDVALIMTRFLLAHVLTCALSPFILVIHAVCNLISWQQENSVLHSEMVPEQV